MIKVMTGRLAPVAFTSAVLVGSILSVAPFVPVASAVTSGIVEADLALNLDPNLNASYPGSGTTVTDLSNAGRNGTLAGSPLPTFDSTGPKSFQFTRTYVGNTSSSANKITVNGNFLTDNFSLQTWIKTSQVGYGSAHYTTMYIMASECGGRANDWGLGVNSSGKLAFGAGTSDATFATTDSVNTNTWTNVAATREKSTGQINLYINGVLKATGTGYANNSLTCSADGKTWIGNGQDAPAYSFGGSISSVLAYTRVLSAADILTNYNATVTTFYPVTYTITYDANGATSGTVPANGSFTSGGAASAVAANTGTLARTGYTFGGWNTSADGSGTAYAAGASNYSTNADVTLYAVWTPVPTTTTTSTTTTTTTTVPSSTTTAAPVLQIVINNPVTTSTTVLASATQSSLPTVAVTLPQSTVPLKSTAPTSRGSGAVGTTSTSTSVAPAPTSTTVPVPVVAAVETGQAAVTKDGKVQQATVSRRDNKVVISVGELNAEVSSVDAEGRTLALDSDGNVTLEPGARIAIKIAGFEPGTEVEMWMFSTPVRIGTATVGPAGTLDTVVTIPADVPTGAHRVAITTKEKGKDKVTFTLGVAVREFNKESNIATWLIVLPILLAVGAALFLPPAVRRRRKESAA
ncbi:MAG: LamG-like jellyroll fold domain-containing protein [Ilumatobacteraceae bacterium]